jgi:hypothetical protein
VADRRRVRTAGMARAGERACGFPLRRPAAPRVEPVGGGRMARPPRAEVHRRHAARLGRVGLSPIGDRPLRL